MFNFQIAILRLHKKVFRNTQCNNRDILKTQLLYMNVTLKTHKFLRIQNPLG